MHPHSNFFSSLSRVEKRLKLETQSPQQQVAAAKQESNIEPTQTESLASPMYLYHSHPTSTSDLSSNLQESEPPHAFFSNSIPIQENPDTEIPEKVKQVGDVNEIETLLQLLGLDEEEQKGNGFGAGGGGDEIFYGKIIGVKGPKSEKELERLNGWIEYFLNKDGDGGIKQPLRLAHLLLAKASLLQTDDDTDDFQGPRFPPTIQDFLHYDPPVN